MTGRGRKRSRWRKTDRRHKWSRWRKTEATRIGGIRKTMRYNMMSKQCRKMMRGKEKEEWTR